MRTGKSFERYRLDKKDLRMIMDTWLFPALAWSAFTLVFLAVIMKGRG